MKLVTIDGPAGSGKSSVARSVAQKLCWTYVTTGAIYRTLGLLFLEAGDEISDQEAVRVHADLLAEFYYQDSKTGAVYLGDREVTEIIRSPKMSELASRVAEVAEVRARLLPVQRRIVLGHEGAVVDGRDMGTIVFPEAPLKIFLTASPEERARRRALEMKNQGREPDFQALVQEIHSRDVRDANRALAPMIPANDSVLVDSTEMDMNTVVSTIIDLAKARKLVTCF